MSKEEWLESLEKDQKNRAGLGMYVYGCFNEEIAEILAEHDKELVQSVVNAIEFNMPHDICSGEEAMEEIQYTMNSMNFLVEEDVEKER